MRLSFPENGVNLSQAANIVPGQQLDATAHRFLAAIRMHAIAVLLLLRKLLQHPKRPLPVASRVLLCTALANLRKGRGDFQHILSGVLDWKKRAARGLSPPSG